MTFSPKITRFNGSVLDLSSLPHPDKWSLVFGLKIISDLE